MNPYFWETPICGYLGPVEGTRAGFQVGSKAQGLRIIATLIGNHSIATM